MARSGRAAHGARACDAPPTRRWLRRRLIAGVAAVIVGIGLAVAGVVVRTRTGKPEELTPGRRETTAKISDVRAVNNGKTGATITLTLAYHTQDGRARSVHLDVGMPRAQYVEGTQVPILYEAAHPDHVLLEGVPVNPPIPWFVPLGLGVLGVVAGALLTLRSAIIRRTLRDNPWVVTRSALVEATASKSARRPVARFLELDGAPDAEPVLAGPLSARIVPELLEEAWVAGSDRRFVVAAVGGAPLARTQRAKLREPAASEWRTARRPQPHG
jgi:Protein of unknown function (DUF3592)